LENARDVVRDAFLTGEGCRVLRFWNHDVLRNREGVLTLILNALLQDECRWLPLTPPSPRKSGERE
jgi:very-short-patch-repair endonuclease